MKKLLSIFAAFGMSATTAATAATVVSCGSSKVDEAFIKKAYDKYLKMSEEDLAKEGKSVGEDASKIMVEHQEKMQVIAEWVSTFTKAPKDHDEAVAFIVKAHTNLVELKTGLSDKEIKTLVTSFIIGIAANNR